MEPKNELEHKTMALTEVTFATIMRLCLSQTGV